MTVENPVTRIAGGARALLAEIARAHPAVPAHDALAEIHAMLGAAIAELPDAPPTSLAAATSGPHTKDSVAAAAATLDHSAIESLIWELCQLIEDRQAKSEATAAKPA